MPIVASYDLTYVLYKQSFELHRRKTPFAFGRYIFLRWVCGPVALVFGALALYGGDMAISYAFISSAFTVWWLAGLWATYAEVKRGYRSSFPANLSSRTVRVELSELEIATSVGGAISSQFEWDSICGFTADNNFILLYLNKARYIPIFLAAVRPDDLQPLRDLVDMHVPGGKKC